MSNKIGFTNAEIIVYPTYASWLMNSGYDLSYAFITMTIRDNLNGYNSGLIQVNDPDNNLGRLTGEEIVSVKLENSNSGTKFLRYFGISSSNNVILQTGESVKTLEIVPLHRNRKRRFSKKLYPSAKDSVEEMLNDLYIDMPLLTPQINAQDIHVPNGVWVRSYDAYLQFVSDYGLSTEDDGFVYAWEDFSGINLRSFNDIIYSNPIQCLMVEEELIGTFANMLEEIPIYRFNWNTDNNDLYAYKYQNATYTASSYDKNKVYNNVVGTGENHILLDRSCSYGDMTYANGYEEMSRIVTLNQYDSYAKCFSFGNFDIRPGTVLEINDSKNLIKHTHIVDDITYDISQDTSYLHISTFSNYRTIKEYEYAKEIENSED